jgi:TRAP-type C4-dicarboxylate transport system permease small subunit
MRRWLDGLYNAAGYLAAFFLIVVLIWVGIGILGRFLGFYVRGSDAYAGYAMAACGFLALAHTLKRGEHIRVELLLQRVGAEANRALQIWSLAITTFLAGLFAFYSLRLVWQSYAFDDISTANDATPLWIPQLAMAAGTFVLLIAFADELVLEIRGERRKPPGAAEPLHNE